MASWSHSFLKVNMNKQSPEGVHVWLVMLKAYHAISRLSDACLQESQLGRIGLSGPGSPAPQRPVAGECDRTQGKSDTRIDQCRC